MRRGTSRCLWPCAVLCWCYRGRCDVKWQMYTYAPRDDELGSLGWLESSRAESRVMALGQDIFGFVAKNWFFRSLADFWQGTEKNQAFCCVPCVVDLPGFCRGLGTVDGFWINSLMVSTSYHPLIFNMIKILLQGMYILCTYTSLFNATKPVRFYDSSLLHLFSNIFLVVFQFPLHILALIPPLFLTPPNAFHFSLSGFHSQRHCSTSFCTERFIPPAR